MKPIKIPPDGLIVGDALRTLRRLPDGIAQVVITSPPYFHQRDYGVRGQLGLESSVKKYLRALVAVFAECHRVLRRDGLLWVNLGDKMMGGRSGGIGKSSLLGSTRTHQAAREAYRAAGGATHERQSGLKRKDLMGLPWALAFALRDWGWYLRMDNVWEKPCPVPESVRDRCTRSHEYLFQLSKSRRYYYDWRAIAERASPNTHPRGRGIGPKQDAASDGARANRSFLTAIHGKVEVRNKRSVWRVAPEPRDTPHSATFPGELVRPMVRASTRPGDLVLDPFAGLCTTGRVAIEEGRRPLMIELNPKYAEIGRADMLAAKERVGEATPDDFTGEELQLGLFAGGP